MVLHGQQIPFEVKTKIIDLFKIGQRKIDIAGKLNLKRKAVWVIINKYQQKEVLQATKRS